ncbi:hypothetical protein GCM10027514_19230 [Azotobacter armeniacus]
MVDVGDDGDVAEIFDHRFYLYESFKLKAGSWKQESWLGCPAATSQAVIGREGGGGYCHPAALAV